MTAVAEGPEGVVQAIAETAVATGISIGNAESFTKVKDKLQTSLSSCADPPDLTAVTNKSLMEVFLVFMGQVLDTNANVRHTE